MEASKSQLGKYRSGKMEDTDRRKESLGVTTGVLLPSQLTPFCHKPGLGQYQQQYVHAPRGMVLEWA